jgi:hypothetical protein
MLQVIPAGPLVIQIRKKGFFQCSSSCIRSAENAKKVTLIPISPGYLLSILFSLLSSLLNPRLRLSHLRAIMRSMFGLTHPYQDDKLIFLSPYPTP